MTMKVAPLPHPCTNLAINIKLATYFGMEAMLADQFVIRLLIDSLKAMETLLAEQKKHIQLLETNVIFSERDIMRP
jgi:hypothetical protein